MEPSGLVRATHANRISVFAKLTYRTTTVPAGPPATLLLVNYPHDVATLFFAHGAVFGTRRRRSMVRSRQCGILSCMQNVVPAAKAHQPIPEAVYCWTVVFLLNSLNYYSCFERLTSVFEHCTLQHPIKLPYACMPCASGDATACFLSSQFDHV